MNDIRIGIIGVGMIVQDFLPQVEKIDGLTVEYLCGVQSDLLRMKQLSETHKIPYTTTDYEQMLNSNIDAVYIAVPNVLHYQMCKLAILANKHAIVEKPMFTCSWQAREMFALAKQHHVMILEAITNRYLTNNERIRQDLPMIGDLKLLQLNYSQYSSRYDDFKKGVIRPAFDPKMAGGALMDLNIYNIHFVTGLLGKPIDYQYYANVKNGIDTSGCLLEKFPNCIATLVGAKDSKSDSYSYLQGDKGYIRINSPLNTFISYDVILNEGINKHVADNPYEHRMIEEFIRILRILGEQDMIAYKKAMEQSLVVCEIMTTARKNSGICFPDDKGD